MNRNVKVFSFRGEVIAVLIKSGNFNRGMEFFTQESSPLQLASVRHPQGKRIEPHLHNKCDRSISVTQEIDILRKGKIRVSLFTNSKKLLARFLMKAGDIILFSSGGHGYDVLKDMEMILVKQGPYAGDNSKDKTYIGVNKAGTKR